MRLTDMVMSFPALIIILAVVPDPGPVASSTSCSSSACSDGRRWRASSAASSCRCASASSRSPRAGSVPAIGGSSTGTSCPTSRARSIVARQLRHGGRDHHGGRASQFLGLGVQPPEPSWGQMLNSAIDVGTIVEKPWIWIAPAVGDRDHRARDQLHRRRPARRARSARLGQPALTMATTTSDDDPAGAGCRDARPSGRRRLALRVEDLVVRFRTHDATVYAVNGVSFELAARRDARPRRRVRAAARASRSLALTRLLPRPAGRIERGTVIFDGRDLLDPDRGGAASRPRRRDRDGLPGPAHQPEPGADDRERS